jgi:hypothetical protein
VRTEYGGSGAAKADGTASADAIELVLTDRISHACKELK